MADARPPWCLLLQDLNFPSFPICLLCIVCAYHQLEFLFAAATVHILSTHLQFLTATPCRPWTDFQGCDIARTPPMDVAYNNCMSFPQFRDMLLKEILLSQSSTSPSKFRWSINPGNHPVNQSSQSMHSIVPSINPVNPSSQFDLYTR